MKKERKQRPGRLNGKTSISARELEQLFDKGDDAIDDYIDWAAVEVRPPVRKQSVTLRIDSDVLEWFRSLGSGYQTRMNAVLRQYKKAVKQR